MAYFYIRGSLHYAGMCVCMLMTMLASAVDVPEVPRWVYSYNAGYNDRAGAWAGGSEIMHIVTHKGKLYAANGYWVDAKWVIPPDGQKQSAQVLCLENPTSSWFVDLDTGAANDYGLQYMKGNILKSVTFTHDLHGNQLAEPHNILVMSAGAGFEGGGAVSVWVRNDESGKWIHTLVRHGSSAGGVRWVPRDIEVYRDTVTGLQRIFLLMGNPGVISGVYDPREPGLIRWDRHTEYPFLTAGNFKTRPLGIAIANNALHFSEGSRILRRNDGPRPTWTPIHDLQDDTDTDVGGIRGLTAIPNPNGPGESLLYLWVPNGRSPGMIRRLDPDGKGGYTTNDETGIVELMQKYLGRDVGNVLGAHNMMYPLLHPVSGKQVHIIGFQGNIKGASDLKWPGSNYYAGALYAVRDHEGRYSVHEINNAYKPGKPPLITPRAFALSPFGDNEVYIGGHDANFRLSDNMAWIFRAPLDVFLGVRQVSDAISQKPDPEPDPRLRAGPVYELRIYQANEDRFVHLEKRFREHTDRIFRRIGLEPMCYFQPVDGTPKQRRRIVYVLKHPSRYTAYENWLTFENDREWDKVLENPEFQGLLAEKPISIFMSENDYSQMTRNVIEKTGGIFEMRTYTTNPGKLDLLNARFRNHTTSLFNRHGINNVAYWTPFDTPQRDNTLIYLIHHANRKQADENWKAFLNDPEWKKVAAESQKDGKFLAQPPERLYLRALDFSPIK